MISLVVLIVVCLDGKTRVYKYVSTVKFVIVTPAAAMEDGGKAADSESGQEDGMGRSTVPPPPQSRPKRGVKVLSRKGKIVKERLQLKGQLLFHVVLPLAWPWP